MTPLIITIIAILALLCISATVAPPANAPRKRELPTTAMPELEFQRTVFEGVNALDEKMAGVAGIEERVQRNIDKLLADPERLPGPLKEDLKTLKKTANDTVAGIKKLEKIQMQLRQEANSSFASKDPVRRIQGNEQLRRSLNALVRNSIPVKDKDGKADIGWRSLGNETAEMTQTEQRMHSLDVVQKAIGEDTGEGATLIIAQLYKEIYDTLAEYGEWSTLGVRRLGTKVTNFPIKTARPVANFLTSEAAPIADDGNYAGNTQTETVLPIAVLLNVSKQLLEDAEFDVTALIMNDFQQAYNQRLDTACYVGTGSGAALDGNFTGLFNGGTAVTAIAGGVKCELTKYDDWVKTTISVAPIVLKRNPRWWMHPFMLVRAMQIKDNNGRPIFLGSLEGPKVNGIGSILGFPVTTGMVLPNNNAPSQSLAAFGDPNGQVVGIRDDFNFEFSDHFRWNTLERSFRAYGRAATGTRRNDAFAVLQTSAN